MLGAELGVLDEVDEMGMVELAFVVVPELMTLDEDSDGLLLLDEAGVLDVVEEIGFVVVPDWEGEGVLVDTDLQMLADR